MNHQASIGRYLFRVLVLAAAYAICARLAILLAIPPGYATAVWPPAGIALAALLIGGYALWPGIFIGAFIKDLLALLDPANEATLTQSLLLAGGISTGITLQALIGAWLIQRLIGYRNVFTQEVDIIRMLALGGPVACTLGATIAVTLLWWAGRIPGQDYLYNWWTWWTGDAIGVVVFAPLVLAWCLRPASHWRRKQIALTVPVTLLLVAVIALFLNISDREQERQRTDFETRARDFTASLQITANGHQMVLDSLKGFYAASEFVSRDEFRLFTSNLVHEYPSIVSIQWLPLVRESDRERFEQSIRAQGFPDFYIFDRNGRNQIIPAPQQPQHFPVVYAEPLEYNRPAIGLDANSIPSRRAAFTRAIDTGLPCATGRLQLIQDKERNWSVLMANPIYRGALDYPTPEARRAHLIGIGQVVMRVKNIVPASVDDLAARGITTRILDTTVNTAGELLYGAEAPLAGAAMQIRLPIQLADRTWTVEFALDRQYLEAHPARTPWGWLAAGLLITALLGLLILVLLARQSSIEEQVVKRTAELELISQDLRRSNAELEQFTYVASHDLSTPLRSLAGFSTLLEREFAGSLDSKVREYLGFIINGTRQLQAITDGLLAVSQAGQRALRFSSVDGEQSLADVLNRLASIIAEHQATVTHDRLPTVWAMPLEFRQLLENLVANAIKFRKSGETPRVHVTAMSRDGFWEFSVTDNGIGIAREHQQRIFKIFQRLHAPGTYEGIGVGLAICHKIVQRHGGRIWVESESGRGSTFYFTLRQSHDNPTQTKNSTSGCAGPV